MKLRKMLSEVICTFDDYIDTEGSAVANVRTQVEDTILVDENMVLLMEMLDTNKKNDNEVSSSGPILDFDAYLEEKERKRKHVSTQIKEDTDEEEG